MKKYLYCDLTFFCLFIITAICSCNDKSSDNIDNLLQIDSTVWQHSSLARFTSLKLYTKEINGIEVCDSINSKCKSGEKYYASVLKQIGIPVNVFESIVTKIDHIGFIKYYRYGDYSVWVENGAFGDIYGYLINHNPLNTEIESFELDKRYRVCIGKKVRENVYYFSSGLE